MKNNYDIKFHVAKEYSRYPGGRLEIHGPYSGEDFRKKILTPLFNNYNNVCIDLSGTMGYGSSFLDESFGELGKIYGIDAIRKRLTLISDDDPLLVEMVWSKIEKGSIVFKYYI